MRIFFLLLFLSFSLHAKTITATYHVSYGIFGEVGEVKTTLKTDDKTYLITVKANTTGFARSLSGERDEYFESKGFIINDILTPKTYTHIVKRKKSKSSISFKVKDWKKVVKKKVVTTNFYRDTIVENREKFYDGKPTSQSSKKLNFFAKNDILSMFFNFKNYHIKKPIKVKAAGAKADDGQLDILPLEKKRAKKIFQTDDGYNFIILVNQPIFSSKKGELFVKINKQGIGTMAILKDVLFFGDITAKLINMKVSE